MEANLALNPISPQYTARKPSARILLNGQEINWISFDVVNNTHYMADMFTLEIPIYNQLNGWTVDRLSKEQQIEVDISLSVDREVYKKFFLGLVDDIRSLDLTTGRATLSGRDYSSLLIDDPDLDKYEDMTASQVAIKFANSIGLTPVVTETSTPIGSYYANDHVELSTKQSKWDLLTYLAQKEQFDVFVTNKELHFQPKPSLDSTPYVVKWVYPKDSAQYHSANALSLSLSRSVTLARDMQVTVRSWDMDTSTSYSETATRKHKDYSNPRVQKFIYTIPGLSKQAALDYAKAQLESLTKHELCINVTLVGDIILAVDNIVEVKGTNSMFDTKYYVYSITRRMSFSGSFVMDLEAKNHSADSEVIV